MFTHDYRVDVCVHPSCLHLSVLCCVTLSTLNPVLQREDEAERLKQWKWHIISLVCWTPAKVVFSGTPSHNFSMLKMVV